MKLGLGQTTRLEQRLVQSPQMIQAMQVLQLSSLDLEERVELELAENPFLEVADTAEEPDDRDAPEEQNPELALRDRVQEEFDRYEREQEDLPRRRVGSSEEGDRKLEAMANTPGRAQTMGDALVEQMALLDLDARERAIAEFVAYSLDERGFLPDGVEELASRCPAVPPPALPSTEGADVPGNGAATAIPPVDPDEVRLVLDELRHATHPALGARDVRESLLLQLETLGHDDSLAARIVADHLDAVIKNQLPKIAKETEEPLEEVVEALEFLRHLDPSPGRDYGGTTATVIHPDVVVEEVDGEYEVRLANGRAPRLQLTPSFKRLLADADKAAEEEDPEERERTHKWLRRKLDGARWFIDAVEQRQNTVLRIAKVIFTRQREFLEKGPKALRPLRMQEVADETGVHISTVSRAVAGKYAQTPRGIHPLKYFFTSGTTDATGEATSQVSIQQRLKEIVEGEDPLQPLSDDQLGAELQKRHGVKIARRTVTKYRKALGVPPSIQRKQY